MTDFEWERRQDDPGPVEVYVLSEAYDLGLREAPWGIDGRPARVGVRFPRRPGEVLLSADALDMPEWTREAVRRLERGEFGGASEHEAQRLRRDRAAAARIAHGRLFLAAHRFNPGLGGFVATHRPYTHHLGVLMDDPYCRLCGPGYASASPAGPRLSPPFYPCPMLRSVVEHHRLQVD